MTAGDSYGPFLAAALAEQRSRKASFEQRGLAVVTSSGTLTAVLAGFVALTGRQTHSVSAVVELLVTVGAVCFVFAAVFGLATNRPVNAYQEPSDEWLTSLTGEAVWSADPVLGSRRVAEANVGTLTSYRAANGRKAVLLTLALGFEVAAVAILAVAVGLIIWGVGQPGEHTYATP